MTAQEIISAALAGMELLTRSIEAANSGDLALAQANLNAARDHYAKASLAWESAATKS